MTTLGCGSASLSSRGASSIRVLTRRATRVPQPHFNFCSLNHRKFSVPRRCRRSGPARGATPPPRARGPRRRRPTSRGRPRGAGRRRVSRCASPPRAGPGGPGPRRAAGGCASRRSSPGSTARTRPPRRGAGRTCAGRDVSAAATADAGEALAPRRRVAQNLEGLADAEERVAHHVVDLLVALREEAAARRRPVLVREREHLVVLRLVRVVLEHGLPVRAPDLRGRRLWGRGASFLKKFADAAGARARRLRGARRGRRA